MNAARERASGGAAGRVALWTTAQIVGRRAEDGTLIVADMEPSPAAHCGRAAVHRAPRRPCVVALALLIAVLAAGRARAAGPCRLVERQADGDHSVLTVDGSMRRALSPMVGEVAIALDASCDGTELRFDIGLRPVAGGGAVRFDLELQSADGASRTLYTRELTAPGWQSASVALGPHEPGAALLFRRTLTGGGLPQLFASAWGNPLLFAAPADQRPAHDERPSIVLVSLDTLRADRAATALDAGRAPALRRLASEGVSYRASYSSSTWTVPSHLGLFLGRSATLEPPRRAGGATGALQEPMLADHLRRAGYLTAGFTGGGFLAPPYPFSSGFDTYFYYSRPVGPDAPCDEARFDGAAVFGGAADWVARHAAQPFFLFIHTYDVHDRCPFQARDNLWGGWAKLSSEQRQAMHDYYDGLIGRADGALAGFLNALDRLGLAARTIVIVTSDHGEAFGEHNQSNHGCTIAPYEELGRVPLIVRAPGRARPGSDVAAPVSGVDIAPTILALAGLPRDPAMRGHPLPGLGLPDPRPADAPVFVHCGTRLAVRVDRFKLLARTDAAAADELYDLGADPGEQHDLRADEAARAAQLRRAARDFLTAPSPPGTGEAMPAQQLDPATREQLRALGYE